MSAKRMAHLFCTLPACKRELIGMLFNDIMTKATRCASAWTPSRSIPMHGTKHADAAIYNHADRVFGEIGATIGRRSNSIMMKGILTVNARQSLVLVAIRGVTLFSAAT